MHMTKTWQSMEIVCSVTTVQRFLLSHRTTRTNGGIVVLVATLVMTGPVMLIQRSGSNPHPPLYVLLKERKNMEIIAILSAIVIGGTEILKRIPGPVSSKNAPAIVVVIAVAVIAYVSNGEGTLVAENYQALAEDSVKLSAYSVGIYEFATRAYAYVVSLVKK